jgi:hypothetical protein
VGGFKCKSEFFGSFYIGIEEVDWSLPVLCLKITFGERQRERERERGTRNGFSLSCSSSNPKP